jgi:pheromone shutdown protein TraB
LTWNEKKGRIDRLIGIEGGKRVLRLSATEKVGGRLTLIGTIHVDPKSASFARETILRIRPEVVALELDEGRLAALMSPEKATARGGGGSFVAMMLLERFAGEMTGSPPGTEMLRAVEAAREVGARVAFIDLPIGMTVGSLRKLPLGEKVRLGVDSIVSLLLLPFGGFNLSKLTENLDEQLAVFRHRYPELSRLLLDVREEHMAAKIRDIMYFTTREVVAVVGYGHMKSLAKSLSSISATPSYSSNVTWNVSTGS